ncbi:hypothetical protein [Swingsia samuiensis]|uniref:Uncharacterized protein n=1 Tax=Swingsia samuiensis TaxID=1293412 RepID=A0A4Y6UFK5_9PROT|nr:hypothetical protein [Swingsia samuiensis]QDH16333.1 hypothetical protein E3D00_01135 [Swingsia samuiensis]
MRKVFILCFPLFILSACSNGIKKDEWQRAGFTLPQEEDLKNAHYTLSEMIGWQNPHLLPQQMIAWRQSNFTLQEAKMFWNAGVYDPKEALLWKGAVGKFYTPKDIKRLVRSTRGGHITREAIAAVIEEDNPDIKSSKQVIMAVYQNKLFDWLKNLEIDDSAEVDP